MDFERTAKALSEIERKTLEVLADEKEKGILNISRESKLGKDSVRRAIGWLSEKKLIELKENRAENLVLTPKGKEAFEKGLPEQRMMKALHKLGSKAGFGKLMKEAGLDKTEFNAALGKNKRKAFVFIIKEKEPMIELTEVGLEFLEKTPEEKILLDSIENKQVSTETAEEKETEIINELIERGLAEKKESTERLARIKEDGKKAVSLLEKSGGKRTYNIHDPAPTIFIGKNNPIFSFSNR